MDDSMRIMTQLLCTHTNTQRISEQQRPNEMKINIDFLSIAKWFINESVSD